MHLHDTYLVYTHMMRICYTGEIADDEGALTAVSALRR